MRDLVPQPANELTTNLFRQLGGVFVIQFVERFDVIAGESDRDEQQILLAPLH